MDVDDDTEEVRRVDHARVLIRTPWSPAIHHTVSWVQCWGIPLVAWDKKYIQQIVTAIGDLLDVDDNIEDVRRVDRARVLIRTPWSPAIHHTVSVDIGGEAYQVQVVEELS